MTRIRLFHRLRRQKLYRNLYLLGGLVITLYLSLYLSGLVPVVRTAILNGVNTTFNLNRNRDQWRNLPEVRKTSPTAGRLGMNTTRQFFIFDAQDYNGSLDFLDDDFDKAWTVLVVNRGGHNSVDCQRCFFIGENLAALPHLKDVFASSVLSESVRYKMAAILHVLNLGAEWIFVTQTPKSLPYSVLDRASKEKIHPGLVYHGPNLLFDPCNHFMDPYIWSEDSKPEPQKKYNIKIISSLSVYSVVRDCLKPSIDATAWPNFFDDQAPVPYIMPGSFGAIDFRNILVHRQSAWVLVSSFLSHLVKGHYQVKINLLVQRVLWESDSLLGFLPTKTKQKDNPQEPLDADLCPSCRFNTDTKLLGVKYVKSLMSWKCSKAETSLGCFQELLKNKVASINHINETTALVSTWNRLLNQVLKYPQRVPLTASRLEEKNKGTPVFYTAAKHPRILPGGQSTPLNYYSSACKTETNSYRPVLPKSVPILDILLVVEFNHYRNVNQIAKMEYLYARFFKYVVYCTEDMDSYVELYQEPFSQYPVTYVQVTTSKGYWGYNCLSSVSMMGYDVAGYLRINDDIIIHPWNFYDAPRHQPWFQKFVNMVDTQGSDNAKSKNWKPWSFSEKSVIATLKRLGQMAKEQKSQLVKRVIPFLESIKSLTCDDCVVHGASDIFYVPVDLSPEFNFFINIFARNKVPVEITVPTILIGMTNNTIYRLRGSYEWYDISKNISSNDHFYRVWKFLDMTDDSTTARHFCKRILDLADAHLQEFGDESLL